MNVKPSHSMLVNYHLNFSVWSVHLQISRCIKASFDASASKKYSYLFVFSGSLPVKHNLILSFVLPSGQNASFSHGFSRYFWHAVSLSRQYKQHFSFSLSREIKYQLTRKERQNLPVEAEPDLDFQYAVVLVHFAIWIAPWPSALSSEVTVNQMGNESKRHIAKSLRTKLRNIYMKKII